MSKMTKTRLQKLLRLFRHRVMFGDKGIRWHIEAHPGGFDFRESLDLSPEDYEAFEDDNDYSLSPLTKSLGKLSGDEVIRLHREISRGGGVRGWGAGVRRLHPHRPQGSARDRGRRVPIRRSIRRGQSLPKRVPGMGPATQRHPSAAHPRSTTRRRGDPCWVNTRQQRVSR